VATLVTKCVVRYLIVHKMSQDSQLSDIITTLRGSTIPSLFLRFVLILQYYVLENVTVLISQKCPYL